MTPDKILIKIWRRPLHVAQPAAAPVYLATVRACSGFLPGSWTCSSSLAPAT